jgi:hypothetical protein
MIKSFSAVTREIDDAEAAVAEIVGALDIEKNLLKNSIGVISCFPEFDDTGALKAICDALPFDCIGATSCLCAAGEEIDQIMLAVTVFTSDTCSFDSLVIPMCGDYKAAIASSMAVLLEKTEEKPKLLLSYFPLMNTVGGDMIIEEIEKAAGGIPLFGTVAIDHTADYSQSKTIHNGVMYRESVVLGAVYGEPDFSFAVASLNENKIRKQKAIITASQGNILIGVNGKPVLEYLEEIGLIKQEVAMGLPSIPFVIEHKESEMAIPRAVIAITPDGRAVCGGLMPEGATLAIGRLDTDDVLNTTESILESFAEKDGDMLIYSCMSRYLALGGDNNAEAEKVNKTARGSSYIFACSAGEICPVPDGEGGFKNIFHNYSIVFCKFS